MNISIEYPIHREPGSPAVAALDIALRDAASRALGGGEPLAIALRLYRSVIVLAQALAGTPNEDMAALLEAVMTVAAEHLTDPSLPVAMSLHLHRVVAGLARLVRRARVEAPVRRGETAPKEPIHREPNPVAAPRGRRPATAMGAWEARAEDWLPPPSSQEHPIHREPRPVVGTLFAEAPLSAWRNDHTTRRDRAARAKLQMVMEDRVYAKVHLEAQRLIAERVAREADEALPSLRDGANFDKDAAC